MNIMDNNLKDMMSLCDCKELKQLIIDNPDLPVLIFAGESAWSGENDYNTVIDHTVRIDELTLYNDKWLDAEDYTEELSYVLGCEHEYEYLSNEEFDLLIDKKVAETEFQKAIVMYVG